MEACLQNISTSTNFALSDMTSTTSLEKSAEEEETNKMKPIADNGKQSGFDRRIDHQEVDEQNRE